MHNVWPNPRACMLILPAIKKTHILYFFELFINSFNVFKEWSFSFIFFYWLLLVLCCSVVIKCMHADMCLCLCVSAWVARWKWWLSWSSLSEWEPTEMFPSVMGERVFFHSPMPFLYYQNARISTLHKYIINTHIPTIIIAKLLRGIIIRRRKMYNDHKHRMRSVQRMDYRRAHVMCQPWNAYERDHSGKIYYAYTLVIVHILVNLYGYDYAWGTRNFHHMPGKNIGRLG